MSKGKKDRFNPSITDRLKQSDRAKKGLAPDEPKPIKPRDGVFKFDKGINTLIQDEFDDTDMYKFDFKPMRLEPDKVFDWGAPVKSKASFVIALLEDKYPGIVIRTTQGMGDYIEVDILYGGNLHRSKIDGTFMASASPKEICELLEKSLPNQPAGESKAKLSPVDPVEDWADNWVNNNGGINEKSNTSN